MEKLHTRIRMNGFLTTLFPTLVPRAPLEWAVNPTADDTVGRENEPTCPGIERLYENLATIVSGAKKEGVAVTLVSGLICTRGSGENMEVLLVRGGGKAFHQPIGGKVRPGEGQVAALHREVAEETGKSVPDSVYYHSTYVQQDKKFAVHAFIYENCPWSAEELKPSPDSDVDEGGAIWTKDFLDKDGHPMLLTEQASRVLVQLGFKVPKDKNTPPDTYDGQPWK